MPAWFLVPMRNPAKKNVIKFMVIPNSCAIFESTLKIHILIIGYF